MFKFPTFLLKRFQNPAKGPKRPMLVGVGLFGLVLVGSWIAIAVPGYSSPVHAANATYVPDMDGLLDARSPGSRHYGWLVNTKSERFAYVPDDPIERVLPSVRRRSPPLAVAPGTLPSPASPVFLDGGAAPAGPSGDPILPGEVNPAGSIGSLGGPGGGVLPGIAGGVGGNVSTPGQDPSMSAVPEPSAWSLMILGFGVLSIVLRRRRSPSLVPRAQ